MKKFLSSLILLTVSFSATSSSWSIEGYDETDIDSLLVGISRGVSFIGKTNFLKTKGTNDTESHVKALLSVISESQIDSNAQKLGIIDKEIYLEGLIYGVAMSVRHNELCIPPQEEINAANIKWALENNFEGQFPPDALGFLMAGVVDEFVKMNFCNKN